MCLIRSMSCVQIPHVILVTFALHPLQSYVLEIVLTLECALDHLPHEPLARPSKEPARKISDLPPLPSEQRAPPLPTRYSESLEWLMCVFKLAADVDRPACITSLLPAVRIASLLAQYLPKNDKFTRPLPAASISILHYIRFCPL